MKNIFKLLFVFIAAGALLVSCDKETNHAMLANDLDASNSTFYLQFKDAKKSLQTDVDDAGNLVNIVTTVDVGLLGNPQSTDIVIPITVDASSTVSANQYTLSATSVTIPAGETSASLDFTAFAAEMNQNETVKLVLNMDAGANPAPAGLQLTYSLFRICALNPSVIEGDWVINMQDSYGDGWNGASITVIIDGVETDYTIDDGTAASYTITVPAGSEKIQFFFNSGDWDEEVTFQILGPNGAEAFSGGPFPAVGEILLDACVL